MGKIERIQVSPEDRERLVRLVRDRNTAQKIVWRSQIVLLAGEGIGAVEVAARVGKSVLTVRRWRRRYAAKGVDGLLKDATRPPGRKPLTARKIKQVVNLTLNEKPPDATHWSERTMAARAGIAPSSVHKIWAAHGLKPHLTRTFKLSRDPNFVAKVEDIVGLYLNPPDKALVLAVDEKSQIQALDRTQPGLPMKKGRCGTMTHDYKRNGTTTLFAALNMLDGTVIGECMPPPASRVPPLPQDHRRTHTAQSRVASHRRQLCHPQDPRGTALAQAAFALSSALHAHFRLMAQHGRAILCRDHPKAHPPRRLQERRRTQASHHGLSR
jgi:transposase